MRRVNRLLQKAKHGDLTRTELRELAASVDRDASVDPYTVLHAIGRAGATELRDTVERYLVCPRDPMLARVALQTLCKYWHNTERYWSEVVGLSRVSAGTKMMMCARVGCR